MLLCKHCIKLFGDYYALLIKALCGRFAIFIALYTKTWFLIPAYKEKEKVYELTKYVVQGLVHSNKQF